MHVPLSCSADIVADFVIVFSLARRQDEQIQTIEATANNVETTMEAGHKEVDQAVVSAKKARRKRWICFWVLIILVIGESSYPFTLLCRPTLTQACPSSTSSHRSRRYAQYLE